ncbi:MAG: hypothetical protein HKN82_11855 [Akkermansiaceae bacterium]|nr:hypothetical protein [Akkermansiaceae bacterium]NNM31391.1 hypothetical protein [Akkermansiaceae bacterium]
MPPPSQQLQSVIDAFGRQGWHCDLVDGREVIQTAFEAHHTKVRLIAQAFPQINALSVVAETPLPLDAAHLASGVELLMRANKQLTLGSFEYDFDRAQLIFRLTNLFEREKFDADIISSMVHCAISEIDRLTPLASTVAATAPDLLDDLSIPLLLEREDLIPPVPGDEEEEEL